jgi:hypothetical protein
MVQNDRQLGHRLGEGSELGQLREAEPGVERQPHPRQHARAGLVFGGRQHALLLAALDLGMRISGDRMTDAAKPVGARRAKRLQHRLDPVAEL